MLNTPIPKTIAEVLELVSKLRSRRAVYEIAIAHLNSCYKKTDAGEPEMRITRSDLGVVSQIHFEESIIEMENRIELIDAELEELQNRPVGGGAPPASQASKKAAQDAAAEATKASEKKGTVSGKPRTQGSGSS